MNGEFTLKLTRIICSVYLTPHSPPAYCGFDTRVCDNTNQDTSKGATFALSMPIPYHFFTTCDYELMRLILAGSTDPKTEEADKSSRIKNINLYPEIDSILT